MNKSEMLDAVIKKFGFEAEETINFGWLIDCADDDMIEFKFEELMSYSVMEEENEDGEV